MGQVKEYKAGERYIVWHDGGYKKVVQVEEREGGRLAFVGAWDHIFHCWCDVDYPVMNIEKAW